MVCSAWRSQADSPEIFTPCRGTWFGWGGGVGGLSLLTEKEAVSLQPVMGCAAVLLGTPHVAHVPRGACSEMEGSRR